RYASGASAIAVPGWPAFACCTESIESVRMVSIESCSMSVFATELLVETLLSFSGRTICLCPLLPWPEHLAEGCRGYLVTTSFQGGNRGAAQRCLSHARERDRARQRVGKD